jgi:hypothetical protein
MGRGGGLKLLSDLRKGGVYCGACMFVVYKTCGFSATGGDQIFFLLLSYFLYCTHFTVAPLVSFIHSCIHELYVYDPPSTSTPILVDL